MLDDFIVMPPKPEPASAPAVQCTTLPSQATDAESVSPFLLKVQEVFDAKPIVPTPPLTYGRIGLYFWRARYQMGIEWKRRSRATDPPDKQAAGDKMLLEIESRLEVMRCPLTDDQRENGFGLRELNPEGVDF